MISATRKAEALSEGGEEVSVLASFLREGYGGEGKRHTSPPRVSSFDSLLSSFWEVVSFYARGGEGWVVSDLSVAEEGFSRLSSLYSSHCSSLPKDTFSKNRSWVQKGKVGKRGVVLSIGDVHCSISSLCRILLFNRGAFGASRRPVLLPNHHIVFTGDLVDRGKTGTQVLCIVSCLLVSNWSPSPRVFLCSGNHEDCGVYTRQGTECLAEEIPFFEDGEERRAGWVAGRGGERPYAEESSPFKVLDHLPSAVLLFLGKKRVLFLHGAVPLHLAIPSKHDFPLLVQDSKQIFQWGDIVAGKGEGGGKWGRPRVGFEDVINWMKRNRVRHIVKGHQDLANYSCCRKPEKEEVYFPPWSEENPFPKEDGLYVIRAKREEQAVDVTRNRVHISSCATESKPNPFVLNRACFLLITSKSSNSGTLN